MGSFFARWSQRNAPRVSAIERLRDAEARTKNLRSRDEGKAIHALQRKKRTSKVVVVGAGFAGLMAAYALSKNCKVKILEARDRIGGRVLTETDPNTGLAVESGAELIGFNHPRWLDLAKKFNLGMTVLTSEASLTSMELDMPFRLNGKKVTSGRTDKLYKEMEAMFARLATMGQTIKNPNKPWETDEAERLDNMSVGEWFDAQHCSPQLRRAIEVELENTNVAPTADQSLLGFLAVIRGGADRGKPDDYFTQSERLKCQQGNHALARALLREVTRGGDSIKLSSPVKAIEIRPDRVKVSLAGGGRAIYADHVVLAVPPSVWHEIKITPALPADHRMSMGPAVKYLSSVKSRFWFSKGLSPSGVSEKIGVIWENSDNQLQQDSQAVGLSLFAGGGAATAAIERKSRYGMKTLAHVYEAELNRLYPGYLKQRVGRSRFINWPEERWTMAGYVSPAPGEVTRISRFLDKPFEHRLHFAGDYCSPAFFGFMEGALQSGLRVATRIKRMEAL